MESKDELKEIDIKNLPRYCFDDIMRAWDRDIDIDFSGILLDKIDVFEGIDANKTSPSKECDICHYWYVLNYSFKFHDYHDLLMMPMSLSDIAILNIKRSDTLAKMRP